MKGRLTLTRSLTLALPLLALPLLVPPCMAAAGEPAPARPLAEPSPSSAGVPALDLIATSAGAPIPPGGVAGCGAATAAMAPGCQADAGSGPEPAPVAPPPLGAVAALPPLPPLPAFVAWALSGVSSGWRPFTAAGSLAPVPTPGAARTGHDVLQAFHEGLAQPGCDAGQADARWLDHFAHAPTLLAADDGATLDLFGHVVDALRQAHLPTEFALIPFIESGYRADARGAGGPVGLWQFIAVTARNHRVPIRPGYDGRLSPVQSTQAAVRYLKTLYGMFGGNWRLAAMAFNAGEHRVLHAMRKAGARAVDARPADLPGLPAVTHAYVDKLHALACVIDDADRDPDYRNALNREVPQLR